MADEKSSPAKQQPKAEPKPSVKAAPETFGLVVNAVFNIQQALGEQMHAIQTLTENAAQQHKDSLEMQKAVGEMKALVKYGAILLVTLASVSAWMFRQMWSLIIPYLKH